MDASQAISGRIYNKIDEKSKPSQGIFSWVLGSTQSCSQGLSSDRGNEVEFLFDKGYLFERLIQFC